MIDIIDILILIWLHFFADFILQSDYIATNKSSNNTILVAHVLIYSIVFLGFGWKFALINGILHYITDYITSKVCSWYWANDNRHMFFVVIGLDQAIHISSLMLVYYYLQF